MHDNENAIWSAGDWRAAAGKLAHYARRMSDATLRREFEEIALGGLRKAEELEAAKGFSSGVAPLIELLTRHPLPH